MCKPQTHQIYHLDQVLDYYRTFDIATAQKYISGAEKIPRPESAYGVGKYGTTEYGGLEQDRYLGVLVGEPIITLIPNTAQPEKLAVIPVLLDTTASVKVVAFTVFSDKTPEITFLSATEAGGINIAGNNLNTGHVPLAALSVLRPGDAFSLRVLSPQGEIITASTYANSLPRTNFIADLKKFGVYTAMNFGLFK